MDLFLQFLTTMAIMYTFMRMGHSLVNIPEEELEQVDQEEAVLLAYISREQDMFYVWKYDTDEFLAQGRTNQELESRLQENVSDEFYSMLKIVDKDNGATLQAYYDLGR